MKMIWNILVVVVFLCAVQCGSATRPVIANSPTQQTALSSLPYYPLTIEADLAPLFAAIGDKPIVLLGEDSHGTATYYNWRSAISKELITRHGFSMVTIEGDWVDTYRLNEYIRKNQVNTTITAVLKQFDRWPQWLWANNEFAEFAGWLHQYNNASERQASIYGLDVYSFEEALDYLRAHTMDATFLKHLQNAKQCLQPYRNDAMAYQRAVRKGKANCGAVVNNVWLRVNELVGANQRKDEDAFLLLQHAAVLHSGERYFRRTVVNEMSSWNIRDRHMYETLQRLRSQYGASTKIIVWAHNTHIGDAHYTDMPGRGRTNLAELLRNGVGRDSVFSVGFGSNTGHVIAAKRWDSAYEQMHFVEAREGSIEHVLSRAGAGNKLMLSSEVKNHPVLQNWLFQRAIGIVQNPRGGLLGSYVNSLLPERYDAFLFFEKSEPLTPLY
jgi:erythromycin esterase